MGNVDELICSSIKIQQNGQITLFAFTYSCSSPLSMECLAFRLLAFPKYQQAETQEGKNPLLRHLSPEQIK